MAKKTETPGTALETTTTATAAAPGAKLKFVALTRVKHDGKHYPAKSTILLGEKEAARLLKLGAIEAVAYDEAK